MGSPGLEGGEGTERQYLGADCQHKHSTSVTSPVSAVLWYSTSLH